MSKKYIDIVGVSTRNASDRIKEIARTLSDNGVECKFSNGGQRLIVGDVEYNARSFMDNSSDGKALHSYEVTSAVKKHCADSHYAVVIAELERAIARGEREQWKKMDKEFRSNVTKKASEQTKRIDVAGLKDYEITVPVYNYLKLLGFMVENELSVKDMKKAFKVFDASV